MDRKTKVSASGKSQASTTKKANCAAKTFSLKNNGNDRSNGRYATKPNLNVVSQSDLTNPHGIGVKSAEALIKHGPFQNFDELLKIPNVGPKQREILQQNFTITDPDRVPSCSTRSSKYPENYYSTNPGKTSTNQTQSRSFSSAASSSVPVSKIAQFDEPHTVNFTSPSSSYNRKKNNRNDTFTIEKQHANDTMNKKHVKRETTPKPNYKTEKSTSKYMSPSSAERSSSTFLKITTSTKAAAVKPELEPHLGWPTPETPTSSKHNPSRTFSEQRQLSSTPLAKTKTAPNEFDLIPAPQSHYDYVLPIEMQTVVPLGHQSPYFTTEKFQSTLPTGMLFLHANIRSIRRNLKNVKSLIEPMQNSPHVICLTDTKNPTANVNTNINGYSYCHAKTHSGAGGVAIYIKIPFKFEIRQDLQFIMSGCENLWIDFAKSRIKLIVGVIYRHQFDDKPTERFNDFKKRFQEIVEKIKKENKLVYILGDFNCNFLRNEKQPRDYKNLLNDLGLKLLITKPTRVPRLTRAHDKPSLIDHIYTNDKQTQTLIAGIIETDDVSDHYPIFCISPYLKAV